MSATSAATVTAVGRRGAGERYAPAPVQLLSERARRLGLQTPEQAWAEYAAQTDPDSYAGDAAWSRGSLWVCCFCPVEFVSKDGARRHMVANGHAVLRWLDRYQEELSTHKARVW